MGSLQSHQEGDKNIKIIIDVSRYSKLSPFKIHTIQKILSMQGPHHTKDPHHTRFSPYKILTIQDHIRSSPYTIFTIQDDHHTKSSSYKILTIQDHHRTIYSPYKILTIQDPHHTRSSQYKILTIQYIHHTRSSSYKIITIQDPYPTRSSPCKISRPGSYVNIRSTFSVCKPSISYKDRSAHVVPSKTSAKYCVDRE